uniref:Gypsy retrotransposon integrase-like protein 1 n=1 Tax=Ciona intestinalis TaxID=7719 RepID=H2XXH0_CIOIN
MDRNDYDKIVKFFQTGEIPAEFETSHTRFGFKRKCRTYSLDAETLDLYYIQKNKDGSIKRRAKVVVGTSEDAKLAFYEVHDPKMHSHMGLNRSLQAISKNYFWPRMTYDITEWIHTCPVCQNAKEADKTKLCQIKVSEPWEILSMEIIGPVNETTEGYKFIFTATDYYSKWVEAFPICNKYPAEVAACLKLIFYRHGACKSVLSDEPSEFINQVNNELCKQLGIQHNVKAVYHPHMKSFDDKSAQDRQAAFLSLVMEHAYDWPHYIDGMLFTMRTKKHPSTRYTPFFLLHKREARMPPVPKTDPIASIDGDFDLNQILQPNYDSVANKSRLPEARVHQKVVENVKQSQSQQILDNARKGTDSETQKTFAVGEKVLLANNRKRPFDELNVDASYSGPFVIADIKTNKVRLMSLKDYSQVKIMPNIDRIIPYRESFNLSMFE